MNIQEEENDDGQENLQDDDELFHAKLYEMRQAKTNPRESQPTSDEALKETGTFKSVSLTISREFIVFRKN